ncbi:MAG: C45 family peptidase [Synergistaceae bacterium]|nr:C45 family peptidase [Synergistaceae bacterium]
METFEKGSKVKNGKLSVIDLHGTWREMGRQYGALMAGELRDIYERAILGRLMAEASEPTMLRAQAEKFFANFPYRLKELLRGMSESSGLSQEELKLVNALEVIASAALSQQCSGIAAWGDYADGALVYGRNYDYLPWFREFDDDLLLACFHPGDGALAVATLGYAGEIYAVNGMNEKGIFLELNNGMPSGGALWYDSRVPAVAELFSFLLDSSTLDEMESFFQTTRANFAYIVGVADGQTARCFEWPVFEVKRRESHSRHGLTVLTNHFTEFSWGLPRPDDKTFWMTRSRRQNLLSLAKHFKGTINEKVMKNIMDTKLEELGATTDMTLYQLVVVPGRYEMWFKIPGSQDWSFIDMRALLRPREE